MIAAKPIIEAVIFDLDGTLLDTETLSTTTIQRIVSNFGKEYTWDINQDTLGKRGDVWTKIVIDSLNMREQLSPQELLLQWEFQMGELCQSVDKLPGALQLISELYMRRIPIAIATSSSSSAVEKKRKHHEDIFSKMTVIVCGDDSEVHHGKPFPDIYIVAAKRLGISPEKCLVFEDALSGVQAGKRAGMHVVACPDARLDHELFLLETPHIVQESNLINFDFNEWNFVSNNM